MSRTGWTTSPGSLPSYRWRRPWSMATGHAVELAEEQPADVSRRGGGRPAGQVREGDGDRVGQVVGQAAEPRAEHDPDSRDEVAPGPDGRLERVEPGGLRSGGRDRSPGVEGHGRSVPDGVAARAVSLHPALHRGEGNGRSNAPGSAGKLHGVKETGPGGPIPSSGEEIRRAGPAGRAVSFMGRRAGHGRRAPRARRNPGRHRTRRSQGRGFACPTRVSTPGCRSRLAGPVPLGTAVKPSGLGKEAPERPCWTGDP